MWAAVAVVGMMLLAPGAPALQDGSDAWTSGDAEAPASHVSCAIAMGDCYEWATHLNPFGHADERATVLVASPDGAAVYAGGWVTGTTAAMDFLVLAFDAGSGDVQWERRWPGPLGRDDVLNDLVVSPDGARVFAVGFVRGDATNYQDFGVLALDAATGEILWTDRYYRSTTLYDQAFKAAVSPDGARLYVTGHSQISGLTFEIATVAYDAATGAREWVAKRTVSYANPTGVAVSPDGDVVYVAARTNGARVLALAYHASNGTLAWETAYNGEGSSGSASSRAGLALSPDGARVFVAGSEWVNNTNYSDWSVLALDAADGAPLWHRTWNGPASADDALRGLAVTPDGSRVVAAGSAFTVGSTQQDAVVRAYDAATGELAWHRQVSLNALDDAEGVALSPDGARVHAVGRTVFATGTRTDYLAFALDAASGVPLWTATYDGGRSATDRALAVAVTPDGARVFATGESRGAGGREDVAVVAFGAADGATAWTQRVDHAGSGDDAARAVVASPDGARVFIAGTTLGTDRGSDVLVGAFEADDGALAWSDVVDGAGGDDVPVGVAVADGVLVVAGHGMRPGTGDDLLTLAYDAATGAELWTARYDGPGSGADRAVGVVIVDGRALVAAESRGATNADVALVTYDLATGAELAVARWDGGTGDDRAAAVAADAGRVFVVGSTATPTAKTDYITLAYDAATSDLLWSARYDGGASGPDAARAVAAAAGVVAVAGVAYIGDSYPDAGTVLYDAATGELRWTAAYAGPADDHDRANAVGVSPDGSAVFMAAESLPANGWYDWAVVAYEAADGAQRWAHRFDRGGEDRPRALAVVPGGLRVIVVGDGVAGTSEATLLAYDTDTGTRSIWAIYDPFVLGQGHRGYGLALSPDGRTAYLAGSAARLGTYHDAVAVAWPVVGPPPPPTSVLGARGPGRGEVTVTWQPPTSHGGLPLTGYVVERAPDRFVEPFQTVAELGVDGRSFTDSGLLDGTRYYYRVSAVNEAGTGTGVTVGARTPGPPGAPRDFAAAAGPGRGEITLSWATPADGGGLPLTAYHVYRWSSIWEDPELLRVMSADATGMVDSGLRDGQRYFYYVVAENEAGTGLRAFASARTFQRPSPPVALEAEPGDVRQVGVVVLSWTPPADTGGAPLTQYRIYRTSGQGGWTSIGITPGTSTSFTDQAAFLPETYHYRVTAENVVGESDPSPTDCTAPSPVALAVNRMGHCRDVLPV